MQSMHVTALRQAAPVTVEWGGLAAASLRIVARIAEGLKQVGSASNVLQQPHPFLRWVEATEGCVSIMTRESVNVLLG